MITWLDDKVLSWAVRVLLRLKQDQVANAVMDAHLQLLKDKRDRPIFWWDD